MGPPVCSVSRSVEEAALDDEWPGKPLHNYIQTKLQLVPKPPPKSPPKTSTPPINRATALSGGLLGGYLLLELGYGAYNSTKE